MSRSEAVRAATSRGELLALAGSPAPAASGSRKYTSVVEDAQIAVD